LSNQIVRDFEFQAGVYFKNSFLMNLYKITIHMNVETENIKEQNIAMERLKFFLNECLDSSVFIENSEKKVIEKFINAGIQPCILPEEPYDQIVTLMLLTKLNAITENRLVVTNITLGSRLSDNVKFTYDIDCPLGPFSESGWWSAPNTSLFDLPKAYKIDKVVKLVKYNTINWEDCNLTWDEPIANTKTEIVFTNDQEK